MIQVNCVRFNMAAADAQSRDLDIRSLWAWYTLGLNVWLGLSTYRAGCWIFDSCLQIILCSVDTWVLVSTELGVK